MSQVDPLLLIFGLIAPFLGYWIIASYKRRPFNVHFIGSCITVPSYFIGWFLIIIGPMLLIGILMPVLGIKSSATDSSSAYPTSTSNSNFNNAATPCTQGLLSKFEQHPVIEEYKNDYGLQLVAEGYNLGNSYWEINKQGDGCLVEFLYDAQKPGQQNTLFHGDKFIIDPNINLVYPQSEGARTFLANFGGVVDLTTNSTIIKPTTIYGGNGHLTTTPKSEIVNMDCKFWSDITLQEIGQELCVYGTIYNVNNKDKVFYLTFGNKMGALYLLSYDWVLPDVKVGDCVQVTAKIDRLGNNPVIVLSSKTILNQCP
jgi:hypothetical protein